MADKGIETAGQLGYHLLWYASQHGVLCIAPNIGTEQTFALPVALYALLAWTAAASFGRRLPALRIPRWAWLSYAAFFLVYNVVLRNLPWEPFTWFYVPNLT